MSHGRIVFTVVGATVIWATLIALMETVDRPLGVGVR